MSAHKGKGGPQSPKKPPRQTSNMDGLPTDSPLMEDAHANAPFHRPADPGAGVIGQALMLIVAMIIGCIAAMLFFAWRAGVL